jgi:hypothetical protein
MVLFFGAPRGSEAGGLPLRLPEAVPTRRERACCRRAISESMAKDVPCVIDFSIVLNAVMTIADEADSQLSQAMDSYMEESSYEATLA